MSIDEETMRELARNRRVVLVKSLTVAQASATGLTFPCLPLWPQPLRHDGVPHAWAEGWTVLESVDGWRPGVVYLGASSLVSPPLGYHAPVVDLRAAPPFGDRRDQAERVALAARFGLRCGYLYRPKDGPERRRDATILGMKAGLVYAHDHDRQDAIRSFYLDRITDLAVQPGAALPVWDGTDYALPSGVGRG